jgi:hypothetical protein
VNPAKPVIEAKERVDDLLTEVEDLLKAVSGPVFHGSITNQTVGDLLMCLNFTRHTDTVPCFSGIITAPTA